MIVQEKILHLPGFLFNSCTIDIMIPRSYKPRSQERKQKWIFISTNKINRQTTNRHSRLDWSVFNCQWLIQRRQVHLSASFITRSALSRRNSARRKHLSKCKGTGALWCMVKYAPLAIASFRGCEGSFPSAFLACSYLIFISSGFEQRDESSWQSYMK